MFCLTLRRPSLRGTQCVRRALALRRVSIVVHARVLRNRAPELFQWAAALLASVPASVFSFFSPHGTLPVLGFVPLRLCAQFLLCAFALSSSLCSDESGTQRWAAQRDLCSRLSTSLCFACLISASATPLAHRVRLRHFYNSNYYLLSNCC